jgi:hypothetical protein
MSNFVKLFFAVILMSTSLHASEEESIEEYALSLPLVLDTIVKNCDVEDIVTLTVVNTNFYDNITSRTALKNVIEKNWKTFERRFGNHAEEVKNAFLDKEKTYFDIDMLCRFLCSETQNLLNNRYYNSSFNDILTRNSEEPENHLIFASYLRFIIPDTYIKSIIARAFVSHSRTFLGCSSNELFDFVKFIEHHKNQLYNPSDKQNIEYNIYSNGYVETYGIYSLMRCSPEQREVIVDVLSNDMTQETRNKFIGAVRNHPDRQEEEIRVEASFARYTQGHEWKLSGLKSATMIMLSNYAYSTLVTGETTLLLDFLTGGNAVASIASIGAELIGTAALPVLMQKAEDLGYFDSIKHRAKSVFVGFWELFPTWGDA